MGEKNHESLVVHVASKNVSNTGRQRKNVSCRLIVDLSLLSADFLCELIAIDQDRHGSR